MSVKKKASVGTRIIEGLQEFVDTLRNKEPIHKKFTCRTIVLDLKPSSYSPVRIRQTRNLLGVSQTLFARFLGVAPSTVRAWEHGDNAPSEIACRFMDEIRRDPQHWLDRLRNAARVK